MTLGELKIQATKVIEEYSSNDSPYTTDSDVQNKMIPAINSAIATIYGLDSSINLVEITETTDDMLNLGVDVNDETALNIPLYLQSALPYAVGSTIIAGDDWNLTSYCNTKFQEIVSVRKSVAKINAGSSRWHMI